MALVTQKLVKFLGFNTFIMETKVGKKEYTVLRTTPTFVADCKQAIKNRIAHCEQQLADNKNNIRHEDENFVIFTNGDHYSKPVMRALKEALTIQDFRQWNALVWQQVVRQLWEADNRDKKLFYFATEMLLTTE